MTTATTTRKTTTRRVVKPGEVNVTNDVQARADLALVATLKATERAGDAAARKRKGTDKTPGPEARLRSLLGADGTHFVVNGQTVATVSSPRHTKKVNFDLLATLFPEAYAACVAEVEYDYLVIQ